MGLDEFIDITVSASSPGVSREGVSAGLIATPSPTWTEHVRTYTDLPGVAADFATTTPEYKAALKWFGVNPASRNLKIGRMNTAPTQVHVVKIESVLNSTDYSINITYLGVTQTATVTSGGSASNDAIVDALVTAVNALASPDVGATATATGSSSSKVLTITADATKTWRAVEPVNNTSPNLCCVTMSVSETTADPSTNTDDDLDAILADSDDWYGLILLYKSAAIVASAAAWANTNHKLFVPASADSYIATVSISTAEDVFEDLLDNSYRYSAPFFHPRLQEFPDAAEMSRFFAIPPGGDNWRGKTLAGVTPQTYTAQQITNMGAKMANFYHTVGRRNIIGGKGRVSSGEYIDVVRGLDAWKADVGADLVDLELNAEKIPYTNAGITSLENVVRAANKRWQAAGLIADTPAPTVTAPLAEDAADADRAARELKDLNTSFRLAGAIDKMFVNAAVST
jgi:hypothetical protein